MNICFFISFLAGISTLIGSVFIFLNPKDINKYISISLSFASGVMFSVSILDLIPEGITLFKMYYKGIILLLLMTLFIFIGIILSFLLDKKIENNNSLLRVGIFSIIVLIIHNIPEGIITFIGTYKDIKLGISLALSIALHNIPEGITISIPIYYATKSKRKALLYTLISGMSEFLGAILSSIFLKNYINNYILGIIFFITSGMMLYISICSLLKEALKYNNKTYVGFILGIILIIVKSYYF